MVTSKPNKELFNDGLVGLEWEISRFLSSDNWPVFFLQHAPYSYVSLFLKHKEFRSGELMVNNTNGEYFVHYKREDVVLLIQGNFFEGKLHITKTIIWE